jgi:ribosome-binding ATPase
MLSIGIIGLPNVGKSSLFNALTSGHAAVSNYPFTTIDSNVGMVPVPDQRLARLNQLLKPEECTPAFVQFTDIAGLVKGASQGEGLGNQFLAHVREVDALVHLLRCFPSPDIAHVLPGIDPVRDLETVETELLLADLEVLERNIQRRERVWKTSPRQFAREQERILGYKAALEEGKPLRSLPLTREEQQDLKAIGLLSGKPVLYAANLSEEDYHGSTVHPLVSTLAAHLGLEPAEIVTVSAGIEAELAQLDPEERALFMKEWDITQAGLEKLVLRAYQLLNLVTFYTTANRKLRAWEIESGTSAVHAAGKIHTDMEKGFIRAQVTNWEALVEHKTAGELQRHGLLKTEGREYVIRDGDVIEFLFSH